MNSPILPGRMSSILLLASAVLALCSVPANAEAAVDGDLDSLAKQAAELYSTPDGRLYFDQFEKAIMPAFGSAMETCGSSTPDTKEPVTFVFVIGADGMVKRVLVTSDVPFGECVAAKLREIKTVPAPLRDSWVVAWGAANHVHEAKAKRPPDRPVPLTGRDLAAYQKAIAPYIAKARATYPSAKKRFLAGLPSGNIFSVRVPLFDHDGKREDSFITVETIRDGKITGTIASALDVVLDYKQGQRITFPESKIDNWVIVNPDGTEEGNVVGKFLDTYKPN